jgi:HSP20 family protein
MPDTPTAPSAALSPARSGPIAWLRSEIDRMAEDLGRPSRDFFLGSLSAFHSPRIDMLEKDGAYHLTAELPGLTEKDVNVTVTDHALVISGEKKSDDERRDDGFLLRERR